MKTTAEIINFILEKEEIKAAAFAKSVGMVPTQIYDLQKGKTKKISGEIADKIISVYPKYNRIWLLTGEGEIIRHPKEESKVNAEQPKTDKEQFKESQPSDEPKINYTSGVPYYNVDFIGGFDLVLNDQTVNPDYLIDFQKYNDATCWCNVTGHSMEPEITHGDMIALKEIKDKSFLPFGEVYAIVTTNEMRTIKRLGAGEDKDHYNLVPTNKSPEYGIQSIPKDMIYKIFSVLGCMKRL